MRNTFFRILTPVGRQSTFILIAFCLILSSCMNPNIKENKMSTRRVTDMNGREVEIPIQVKSAVAHGAGALRFVCYLDATEFIIGIEGNEKKRNVAYLYANPELKELPIIGSANNAEPELITAMQPDLIICTYLNSGEADELEQKTGIPVICLNYGDFNEHKKDFYTSLQFLGDILYKRERADFLIQYIEDEFKQIQQKSDSLNIQQKVYIGGIAYRGAHGINSTEPAYAPFRFVQAQNVATSIATDTKLLSSKLNNVLIDKEQIIEWNPDKIFIDAAGYLLAKDDLNANSVVGSLLNAVQQNEVYYLLPHIWNTINYEHILINSFYVSKVLQPQLYQEMNIRDKANEIYKTFLGKPIYDDIVNLYGMGCQKSKKI